MRILESLSHMPYYDGARLIFCESAGIGSFFAKPTLTDAKFSVSERTTRFQMWSPVIRDGDSVVKLHMPFKMDTPKRVYCNPVLEGDKLSFCYGRALFYASVAGASVRDAELVSEGVFTGFRVNGMTVLGKHACATGSQIIIIEPGKRTAVDTLFKFLLRVVPHNGGFIVTGGNGQGRFYSVFVDADHNAFLIQVAGADVYKCVLSADNSEVTYAVKGTDFEERHLHADAATLTPLANFWLAKGN